MPFVPINFLSPFPWSVQVLTKSKENGQELATTLPGKPIVYNFPQSYSLDDVLPAFYSKVKTYVQPVLGDWATNRNLVSNLPPNMYDDSKMYLTFGSAVTDFHVDDSMAWNLIVWSGEKVEVVATWLFVHSYYISSLHTIFEELAGKNGKERAKDRPFSYIFRSQTFMKPVEAIKMCKDANIPVTVVYQRMGDLVLVPPNSAHIVWTHAPSLKVAQDICPPMALMPAMVLTDCICNAAARHLTEIRKCYKDMKAAHARSEEASKVEQEAAAAVAVTKDKVASASATATEASQQAEAAQAEGKEVEMLGAFPKSTVLKAVYGVWQLRARLAMKKLVAAKTATMQATKELEAATVLYNKLTVSGNEPTDIMDVMGTFNQDRISPHIMVEKFIEEKLVPAFSFSKIQEAGAEISGSWAVAHRMRLQSKSAVDITPEPVKGTVGKVQHTVFPYHKSIVQLMVNMLPMGLKRANT